jgi:hypothetical protein
MFRDDLYGIGDLNTYSQAPELYEQKKASPHLIAPVVIHNLLVPRQASAQGPSFWRDVGFIRG